MKQHPAEMERVTVASVRAALDAADVEVAGIWQFRQGVVRVDVRGWTSKARMRARQAVCEALEPKKFNEFWTVWPVGVSYRWRPWRTWITVRDPRRDWYDGRGRNFLEASEGKA